MPGNTPQIETYNHCFIDDDNYKWLDLVIATWSKCLPFADNFVVNTCNGSK